MGKRGNGELKPVILRTEEEVAFAQKRYPGVTIKGGKIRLHKPDANKLEGDLIRRRSGKKV